MKPSLDVERSKLDVECSPASQAVVLQHDAPPLDIGCSGPPPVLRSLGEGGSPPINSQPSTINSQPSSELSPVPCPLSPPPDAPSLSQPSTINHPPSTLPFSPAPTESAKAFETFLCYFDIGHNRSFASVARLTGVNLNTVKQWANRYDWRERVRAYNTLLLRTRLAVETDARRNQAELRAQRALFFQEAEWKAAEKLLRAAQNVLDLLVHTPPEKLSLSDVARALDIASKIGRLATGLATEQIAHGGEVNVNLQLEIESAIQKVYGPIVEAGILPAVEPGFQPGGSPAPTPPYLNPPVGPVPPPGLPTPTL